MSATKLDADLQLLLVDDDDEFRELTARNFRKRGATVEEARSGEEALSMLSQRAYDVAVLDIAMPGLSGVDVLEKQKSSNAETEFVMLTGETDVRTAVEAMKLGAHDYLTKPAEMEELAIVVRKAYEVGLLRIENRQLKELVGRTTTTGDMIGESPVMKDLFRLIQRAGPTDKPILIQGESGTGKELVARALHQQSTLADKPLVVINCAALPEQLLESELFGHEKGAFTGAAVAKPGLLEIVDGGTLFIDEIGELAGPLQAKLLRVLEDGSLRRVGATKERRIRVRLLTATNRDMEEEVKAGRFREDLYYRIDVLTLKLPPLREREDDVSLLARHFAGPDWQIEPDALKAIERYSWPGNVRQLINSIERAKILADDDVVKLKNLPDVVAEALNAPNVRPSPGGTDLAALQKAHVTEVLKAHDGNKVRAARALGVSRRTLYRLVEKHCIDLD
ncbi:MAG: sigma-54-dependent transcriptional regulator [Aeoliella sp.]